VGNGGADAEPDGDAEGARGGPAGTRRGQPDQQPALLPASHQGDALELWSTMGVSCRCNLVTAICSFWKHWQVLPFGKKLPFFPFAWNS